MFIINAKTSNQEPIYIAVVNKRPIWTSNVELIKIFGSPEIAATYLNLIMQHKLEFENYVLADSNTIKISELQLKELY